MSDIQNILTNVLQHSHVTPNVYREEYVQIVGLNPSSLVKGLVGTNDCNPTAIKMAYERPDSTPRTIASQDSLDRGTLAHLMILQPEQVAERVAVWKGGKRIGKKYDEWTAENTGRLQVTAADNARVSKATNALRYLAPVAKLFCGNESEVAIVDTEQAGEAGPVIVKGQVDSVRIGSRLIVDLKTTERGIDPRSVERTIRQFHNREKMAMYRRWMARHTATEPVAWECWNVFMSLADPPGAVCVKFTNDALEWAESRMLMAIQSVGQCLAKNEWPMYCREMFMGVEIWESDDDGDVDYGE